MHVGWMSTEKEESEHDLAGLSPDIYYDVIVFEKAREESVPSAQWFLVKYFFGVVVSRLF